MSRTTSGKQVEWFYQRKNCKTCDLARAWMEQAGLAARATVDCRKEPLDADEAVALARKAADLHVTRGKKVVHLNLRRDQPTDEELRTLVVGPSGNLRAPAIRHGRTLLVGFDADTWAQELA